MTAALAARGVRARQVATTGSVGGGAFPTAELPSAGIAIETSHETQLDARLRLGRVPVVGRIEGGALVLDLRAVRPAHDEELLALVSAAFA